MKTLNLRFLGILVLGVVILGAAFHFLHGFQVRANADVFLRKAQDAMESGEKWEAIRNLQRYLGLARKDDDAMADLGVLLADVGAHGQAYQMLEEVLRRDGGRTEVRRRLVDVAIELRRFSDARVHLEKLLEISPADHKLLAQMGRCYAAGGEYAKAVESYTKAIESKPDQVEVYARLADVYRIGMERPGEADRWMRRMVEANPDSAEAHVRWGRRLKATRRLDEAAGAASKALTLAPEDADALVLAVQCAVEREEFDDGRQYANRLIELHPHRIEGYTALANIEAHAGDQDEAIRCLKRGREANPKQVDLLWMLGLQYREAGQLDEAEQTVEQLIEAEYPLPRISYLEARIDLAKGNWLAAQQRLERIRGELTQWPDLLKRVDLCLGECYHQLGNADQQLTAYRRAVQADPLWIPARVGLASALLSTGRIEEALQEFRQLMRMDRAPAAGWIDLARLVVLKNLRLDPADRDWFEAERLIEFAERANPDNASVPILRAEVFVAQDRMQDAEVLLQESQEKYAEDTDLQLALAALAQRQRDWERAEKLLDKARSELGDSVALRLARAQCIVRRHGREGAETLRTLANGIENLPKEELPELWAGLAMASLSVEDYAHARGLCQRLSKADPNNLRVWLLLFDLALRAEDDSGMDRVLGEIGRIEGQGPLWRYGRALHVTLQGNESLLPQALELLADAGVSRPAWSRVPFLAAKIHEMLDEEEQALKQYTRAIELGERNTTAIRRAIELLTDRQRFLEADRLIRRLEEQYNPFSASLARLAAEVSLRLDNFDRALEIARQAAADSKEYRDHIWLGQVLSILGQRAKREGRIADSEGMLKEAEKELRRAIGFAPEATDAWVAIIGFFARTDQSHKAEQAIAEAQQHIPEGMGPLALAQCYEVMGRLEEAEANYQEALAAASSDSNVIRQVAQFYLRTGRPRPAEMQMRRITAGEVEAEEADLVWGRRALALILSERGGYENLKQGLALVEENLARADPAVEDQRAKAHLLSAHPKRRQRDEAIAILEDVVQHRRVSTPRDRFVLARLYLAKGDWSNANRHMRQLLASHGGELQYVAAYVEMLLNRKEIQEAELWMRQLQRIAASEFTTARLRSQLLYHRARHDDSIGILKQFLDKPDVDEADRPARMERVAAALAELALRAQGAGESEAAAKYTQEAEALYRRLMEKKPTSGVVLAAFLARMDRVDEALALVEQAWEESRPEILAATLVVLLQETNATPSELERTEALLRKALEKYDRPTGLLMTQADLRTFQGRCDEAEALYREILTKGKNAEAMNNLALLLAVQGKQLEEARRLIEEAIELAGPTVNLLDSRALVWMALGKPEKAIEDLNEIATEGIPVSVLFHLAQALQQADRNKEAQRLLAKVEELGLKPELLHPLERPAYARLKAVLALKP